MEIGEVLLEAPPGRPAAGGAGPDFDRAVGLLRLLLANVSAELVIRQLRSDLHGAQESVRRLRAEFGRLRQGIRAPLPPVTVRSQAAVAASASQRLVDQMLAYAHEHYHRPMGLKEVAQALGRNASYLSTLFSHRNGLAFHAYLDELRLAKAKELLSDRTRTIAQIASETGYASEDWFRHAFKAHTGLSPSTWRRLEA
jgi:AraC-like DNA-binding protein